MPLVHVITGRDALIRLPQYHRPVRITLQIHPGREFPRRGQRKHFPRHLEHQCIRTKRSGLLHVGQGQAQVANTGKIHPE